MVIKGDIVTLSKKGVEEFIDKECRRRLGMSTKEFVRKRKHGELPKSIAVHDIKILLKLCLEARTLTYFKNTPTI